MKAVSVARWQQQQTEARASTSNATDDASSIANDLSKLTTEAVKVKAVVKSGKGKTVIKGGEAKTVVKDSAAKTAAVKAGTAKSGIAKSGAAKTVQEKTATAKSGEAQRAAVESSEVKNGKRAREVAQDDPNGDSDDDGDDDDDSDASGMDEEDLKNSAKAPTVQALRTKLHCARRELAKHTLKVENADKTRKENQRAFEQQLEDMNRPHQELDDVSIAELRYLTRLQNLEAMEQGTLLHLLNCYVRASLDIQTSKMYVRKYETTIKQLEHQIQSLERGRVNVEEFEW